MITRFLLSTLVILRLLLDCTSASVHSHSINNLEREEDGSFRPRDATHYDTEGNHNREFDHEVILGSVKEAEEYDKLSPEEARERLSHVLPQMDLDGDRYISKEELHKWIMGSFRSLGKEEANERLVEMDTNSDGSITWKEYLQDAFGVTDENEISADEAGESGAALYEEKIMWTAADLNGDGTLNQREFEMFINAEDHEALQPILVNQTIREKDTNQDGVIDFEEFISERSGNRNDQEFILTEKDKFEHDLDVNKDGVLDRDEVKNWIIPDNNEIAKEEVDHLVKAADADSDGRLSYEEILSRYEVFVGSDSQYGSDHDDDDDELMTHFDDEL